MPIILKHWSVGGCNKTGNSALLHQVTSFNGSYVRSWLDWDFFVLIAEESTSYVTRSKCLHSRNWLFRNLDTRSLFWTKQTGRSECLLLLLLVLAIHGWSAGSEFHLVWFCCGLTMEQEAHQLVGQAKCCATKIRHTAVGGGIFDRFFELRECRPEVADYVISGVAID